MVLRAGIDALQKVKLSCTVNRTVSRFLVCPPRSLVTKLNELSRFHLTGNHFFCTLIPRLLSSFPSSFLILTCFVCFWRDSPPVGQGLLIHEVSRSHRTTHHSRQDSSGRVISSSQRPLSDNTQHSQQTNIHASGGIRTHNLSRRAAANLRLIPRGHWDRL